MNGKNERHTTAEKVVGGVIGGVLGLIVLIAAGGASLYVLSLKGWI